jgi:hypothetical protein
MATLEDYRGLEVLNVGTPLPEAGSRSTLSIHLGFSVYCPT